jgi:PleD family two-component response regulator
VAQQQPVKTILIADDDPDLRDILRSILEPAGFTVDEAADGAQALQAVRAHPPDLVILDWMMPTVTGLEVCERLKQDLLLRHVPIIMLTGKGEIHEKVDGINAGADDFLVKPFEPQELLARIRMVLRRTAQGLEANPLTRLPGNLSIQRELESRIASGERFAVCYVDLNHFKSFNDHYGFKRGDEVIERTAKLLLETSRAHGSPTDFVGHIGGDDFIVITNVTCAEGVCRAIIREFDAMVPRFHDEHERAVGYFLHPDRKGQELKIPLLSVAVVLVTNAERRFSHPGEIAKISAELKAYAKQSDRSTFLKERRQA